LFSLELNLSVCGEAESEGSALAKMGSARPDVAIVDLALKSSSGLALIAKLRKAYPELKILAFSMLSESIYAERALKAGADGFLSKEKGTDNAIQAVHALLRGKTFVSAQLEEKMFDRFNGFSAGSCGSGAPTKREWEVLDLLGRGCSPPEIARQLGLTVSTVGTHYQSLRKKLGLKNGTELVHYAMHWVHDPTAPRRRDFPPAEAHDRQGRIGPPTRLAGKGDPRAARASRPWAERFPSFQDGGARKTHAESTFAACHWAGRGIKCGYEDVFELFLPHAPAKRRLCAWA
jgi:DNA-binding NarL/FixJ family response regulator